MNREQRLDAIRATADRLMKLAKGFDSLRKQAEQDDAGQASSIGGWNRRGDQGATVDQ